MAQKVEVVRVDDLDGTENARPVTFGLGTRFYTIDLAPENEKELKDFLKRYIRKAEATAPPSPTEEPARIREWAKDNGYDVAARGRIHQDIVDAYRNAEKG